MVMHVVAFLGAYLDPSGLDPWLAGIVASLPVTWVTFAPSFLFILLYAPYAERLRGNRSLGPRSPTHHPDQLRAAGLGAARWWGPLERCGDHRPRAPR
jgi:hypothetical protein